MQWNWATSLDQLWRSPAFPVWAAVVIASFAALILLIIVLRADRTLANLMLAGIAVLALGVAAMPLLRGPVGSAPTPLAVASGGGGSSALPPAVSCLDGLAGETVEDACERAVFASPESLASAVSYAAAQIGQLRALNAPPGGRELSADQQALLRAIERDRYGLVAQVLMVRERCVPTDCATFQMLSNHERIRANMAERLYDGMVARYATAWAAPPAVASLSTMPASLPTGKPTTQDFPSSSSIPPVNIMTPEPAPRPATASAPPAPTPRPAAAPPAATAGQARPQPAKKQAAQQQNSRPAPRSLTPPAAAVDSQAADD